MRIFALDLAEYKIGWALGSAGMKPRVQLLKLRKGDMTTNDAVGAFGLWLHAQLNYQIARNEPVDLVVAENYIAHGALKGFTNADVRDGAILLNGALRGVCGHMGIPVRCPDAVTVRVHFCGKASGGDRAATKAMVIKQAQLLDYIPRDCKDDNMADAAALFDFASSHFASKAAAFQLRA